MRESLRALAFSGALAAAVTLAPSLARGAQAGDGGAQVSATPATAERPGAVPAADVQHALSQIKISWRTFDKCDQRKLCATYFDSFGVGLTFADGTIAPFTRVQRMNVSEHDCINNARAALEHGDRGLAVQWVMAAKLTSSPSARNWLGDHPDAVVAALHDCCF